MSPKKVAVAGSSGYLGRELMRELKEYDYIKLVREDFKLENKQLAEKIYNADVVINLAGYPIIKRWTNSNKRKIYESRIMPTSKLADAIALLNRNVHFINASAIGIYNEVDIHDETSNSFSDGFIQKLITDWEKEAMRISSPLIKTTVMRIGIVLSKNSGIIERLWPFFKMGVGGTIGSGRQWMSFIHIFDLMKSIRFIIENKIPGVVNITAPYYTTNKDFTKTMAALMHKPAFLSVPVFMLKLFYGKGAQVIYSGHRIIPQKLLNQQFKFRHPDIRSALEEIIVH